MPCFSLPNYPQDSNVFSLVCFFITPLIPAREGWRQVDHYEFKDSLVFIVSSRPAKATQCNPHLKENNKNKKTD